MKHLQAQEFKKLLEHLCRFGLGNYYALYRAKDHVYFGKINYEKGHLAVKDDGLLAGLHASLFEPVWHEGLLGMICYSEKYDWESLTYYGLDHCKIKPDLSQTRGHALIAAQNQYGDSIMDFQGSIYRGFQLLLDNSFLPVILLNPIMSINDEPGLIVSDLRTAPMKIKLLIELNDLVVKSVENIKTLQLNDVDMSATDFHKYFDNYIEDDGS